MNSESRAVQKDAGDAVRYLQNLAKQIEQIAADVDYGLSQDIHEARADKVDALANGDTASEAADTAAVREDMAERKSLIDLVGQDQSVIKARIVEIVGLNHQERAGTTGEEKAMNRGQVDPSAAGDVQQQESAAIDARIQGVKDRAFDQVQVIGDQVLQLSPAQYPNNAPANPGTLAPPPQSSAFQDLNNGGGGGSQNGGGSGSQTPSQEPGQGSWSGVYTANGISESMTITITNVSGSNISGTGSLTRPRATQPDTYTMDATYSSRQGKISGTFTGTYEGVPLRFEATFDGRTWTGTTFLTTGQGKFKLQ
jgi:hypothetical protein